MYSSEYMPVHFCITKDSFDFLHSFENENVNMVLFAGLLVVVLTLHLRMRCNPKIRHNDSMSSSDFVGTMMLNNPEGESILVTFLINDSNESDEVFRAMLRAAFGGRIFSVKKGGLHTMQSNFSDG